MYNSLFPDIITVCCYSAGPTRRFRRVCEKLQTAMVNPSSINMLCMEMADYERTNPSLSSDDTLTTSTASPILGETLATASSSSREDMVGSTLLGSYDSTEDDCESEDGFNTNNLLGDPEK